MAARPWDKGSATQLFRRWPSLMGHNPYRRDHRSSNPSECPEDRRALDQLSEAEVIVVKCVNQAAHRLNGLAQAFP